ncbi:MAG: hypothetical protein KJ578_12755 [Bacteroidetes bacterium]|nr:hypothetical protein [Bacteroidota bacterium]MBU2558640.1 hypothetical protein [Bacteroidota bacterium]
MFKNIFSSSKPCTKQLKLDISYQYNQASSEKLIVYNLGSNKVVHVEVVICNTLGKKFEFNLPVISMKTGQLLDYKHSEDINFKTFEGEIHKVVLKVSDKHLIFKANGDKFEQQ